MRALTMASFPSFVRHANTQKVTRSFLVDAGKLESGL